MDVYEALSNEFSIPECLSILVNLSNYHRIQGSSDLEKAAEYIARILNDNGLNAKIYSYSYKEKYGLMGPLIGWNVKSAELQMIKPKRKILHTFDNTKTLVVAHSPGGEIEAPVVYIGKGEEDKDYENKSIEGKIVLSYGNPYNVYKKAIKKKVAGIIFYKKEAPEDAVPYSGLFLDIEEANEANAIALNISKRNAEKILTMLEKNEEVILKAKVDIEYRNNPQIKIVETNIGNSEEEIKEKKYVRKFIGPLSLKWLIKNLGEEKIAWLRNLIDKEKYYSTIFMNILPMLLNKPISFTEIINKIEAEIGIEIDKEKIILLLKLLCKCNLIAEL